MSDLKTERHHWWPKAASKFWADNEGMTTRIEPDGKQLRLKPEKHGFIKNGHFVRHDPGAHSVWDSKFEKAFEAADSNFPGVINHLKQYDFGNLTNGASIKDRLRPQPSTKEFLETLAECLISLAVRSPRTREQAVGVAEHLRGPLPE
ncbi:MAG: hypothetical protein ACFE0P_10965 [Oceanicaulis sp.]